MVIINFDWTFVVAGTEVIPTGLSRGTPTCELISLWRSLLSPCRATRAPSSFDRITPLGVFTSAVIQAWIFSDLMVPLRTINSTAQSVIQYV